MTTTRDRVLRWHRRGWSAKRIAEKIDVTTNTVYYHLHQLEHDGSISNPVRRYRPRRKK